MTRIGIYTNNLKDYLTSCSELRIFEMKLQYWCIKEIYFSPYRTFLNNLTYERFTFRFLKAKKYCGYDNLYKFLNYFIKCVQEDFYKNKKEKRDDDEPKDNK